MEQDAVLKISYVSCASVLREIGQIQSLIVDIDIVIPRHSFIIGGLENLRPVIRQTLVTWTLQDAGLLQ